MHGILEAGCTGVDVTHAVMRELFFMLGVPLEQFMGCMVKNRLIAWPAFCDQLLHDVLVGVQDTRCSEELRRLQFQLVRL